MTTMCAGTGPMLTLPLSAHQQSVKTLSALRAQITVGSRPDPIFLIIFFIADRSQKYLNVSGINFITWNN
jgi:hypothetical protein